MFLFPPANALKHEVTYKDIVTLLLKNRPKIKCEKMEALLQPAVTRSETEQELDKLNLFKARMKGNFQKENLKQKE